MGRTDDTVSIGLSATSSLGSPARFIPSAPSGGFPLLSLARLRILKLPRTKLSCTKNLSRRQPRASRGQTPLLSKLKVMSHCL
ncbi:MAG: hypothetical protein ACKOC0_02285 [Cytophagales bacterium]